MTPNVVPAGYTIVCLDEDDYESLEDAYRVFSTVNIRPSREEHVKWLVIYEEQVIGAATFAHHEDHDFGGFQFTFSVALIPAHQQKGLGRQLVERALAEARSLDLPGYFRVWVVNPHMAKLLESLGFSTENSSGWTEKAPHMYLYL